MKCCRRGPSGSQGSHGAQGASGAGDACPSIDLAEAQTVGAQASDTETLFYEWVVDASTLDDIGATIGALLSYFAETDFGGEGFIRLYVGASAPGVLDGTLVSCRDVLAIPTIYTAYQDYGTYDSTGLPTTLIVQVTGQTSDPEENLTIRGVSVQLTCPDTALTPTTCG